MLLRHASFGPLLLLGLASCSGEGPTEVAPPVEPAPAEARMVLVGVDSLVAGESVTLRGSELQKLSSLRVEGQAVSFQRLSAGEVRFTVPELRKCETEGRRVAVVANDSIQVEGVVRVPKSWSLRVGESRVIGAAELACLQLSGRSEDYLLSVASLRSDPVIEPVFRLRTGGGAPVAASRAVTGGTAAPSWAPPEEAGSSVTPALVRVAETEPFDPRYGTAQVGDTIRLADWEDRATRSATSRVGVPSYSAVVVALAGRQLVAVDLRIPGVEVYFSAEGRQKMQRAAEMIDRSAIPALRAILDPSFEPLPGAGGRMLTLIQNYDGPASVVINDAYPSSVFPAASRMMVATLPRNAYQMSAENAAGLVVHEFTHIVDFLPKIDRTGSVSAGWYSEAVANTVRELAARLVLGQEADVPLTSVKEGVPSLGPLGEWPSRYSHTYSPFGKPGAGGVVLDLGAYDIGTRLLLYARERMGQAGFAPEAPLLHQRLKSRGRWDVESLAAEVGIPVAELIDEMVLAALTDDLVAEEAVRAERLPQIRSWSNRRSQKSESAYLSWATAAHVFLRGDAVSVDVSVPSGSHHHWYIPASEGRGFTVQAEEVRLQPHHRVRLTRLR